MSQGTLILNSDNGTHANGTLSSSGEVSKKCKTSLAGAGGNKDSRFPQLDFREV